MNRLQSMLKRSAIAFARWFDTSVGHGEETDPHAVRVDWVRSIPFVGLHLMCFGIIWVGWSWTAVGVAAAMYFIRMFALTGIYHRYFSHRTYRTSRPMQFALAVLGGTAVQRGPLWWASQHRHHHANSDQEDDAHSPHQHGFMWSHMLWFTSRTNFAAKYNLVPDLAKFPELKFLDRFDALVPALLGTSLFFLGSFLGSHYPSLNTSGPQMLIWGFFVSTIVVFHAACSINSVAHWIGRKRYVTGDRSGNSFPLAVVTLGEGWHNNHHHYPSATRQGFYWWEIDITYYVLKALSWTRLIWDLKPVPAHALLSNRVGADKTAA